jgi:alanyl-tRNA synthetase
MAAPATVEELRQAFLRFFEAQGHRRIPSSSLIPYGDPTLLFTTAGMVQFKPYFMGLEEPPAPRLTSIQKCFRTTDVEEVGDESHLTFFEMLGNFSVGDYFKKDAIGWAWAFMTGELGIPAERLWATVYTDDDEAFELWRGLGVPAERILRYTAEQGNYWYSGEVGPCGPCSELHYDFGETPGCAECEAASCHPDAGCGRFLEVWNLVFMTYFQDEAGEKTPLPAQNIDTGAGLERVAAVVQGVRTVYETDELRGVLAEAEAVTGRRYDPDGAPEVARALRAITEHARACAFLVADGVLPSNDGRGYVLRRVIRRAVYFGHTVGLDEPFFERLVGAAIEAGRVAYPDLGEQAAFIRRIAAAEEARFQATLVRGLELLEQVIERAGEAVDGARTLPGREMFALYDTHGLPPELTREVAQERGLAVDEAGFEREMEAQRERSRGITGSVTVTVAPNAKMAYYPRSEFIGYDSLSADGQVGSLVEGERGVSTLAGGIRGELVLDLTSFYPEGGGQVGDRGEIVTAGGRFRVDDTQRLGDAIVHRGEVVEGEIALHDAARTLVDEEWRTGSQRNHTATHLLHSALRSVLGSHVRQGGSLVAPDRLRFDYTLPEAPPADALRRVQRMVNERVRHDIPSRTVELPYDEAIDRGAIAFFEDRYMSEVRVVEYCDPHDHDEQGCWSSELCGGTHLPSTGRVGSFVIVSDASIGSGLRRIEALTGPEAERYIEQRLDIVSELAQRFRSRPEELPARVTALEEQLADERRRGKQRARSEGAQVAEQLAAAAEEHDSARLVIARVEAESQEALRALAEAVRARLGECGFALLGAEAGGRPIFVAAATDAAIERGLRADEIVRLAAQRAGGGGGGRPGIAQAGGKDVAALEPALDAAGEAARARLRGES